MQKDMYDEHVTMWMYLCTGTMHPKNSYARIIIVIPIYDILKIIGKNYIC